jgi:glycosyltransferase involved in cell wall biosynthesis
MNVVFVNLIGREKFGGGEKWMISAATQLAGRGHRILMIGRAGSVFLDRASQATFSTKGIGRLQKLSGAYLLQTAAILLRFIPDAVICNLNTDVRSIGLVAKLLGTPVVLARHGLQMYSDRKLRYRLSARYILDGIITNSKTIKDAYAGFGWFDDRFVKVIYNGIEIPAEVHACNFAERFPGRKIIYSAGRLSLQKGFEYLIEAAAILKAIRDDLVFVISGEGKLEAELREKVRMSGLENCVFFEGFSRDIFPYLKCCTMFVLASLYEGMPNVVMEAMAMSKPVIATDVNGARELMVDGSTGLIVPPADARALAEAIGTLADRPDMMALYGANGLSRVSRQFTMQKMGDLLEAYLQDKLEEKHSYR